MAGKAVMRSILRSKVRVRYFIARRRAGGLSAGRGGLKIEEEIREKARPSRGRRHPLITIEKELPEVGGFGILSKKKRAYLSNQKQPQKGGRKNKETDERTVREEVLFEDEETLSDREVSKRKKRNPTRPMAGGGEEAGRSALSDILSRKGRKTWEKEILKDYTGGKKRALWFTLGRHLIQKKKIRNFSILWELRKISQQFGGEKTRLQKGRGGLSGQRDLRDLFFPSSGRENKC